MPHNLPLSGTHDAWLGQMGYSKVEENFALHLGLTVVSAIASESMAFPIDITKIRLQLQGDMVSKVIWYLLNTGFQQLSECEEWVLQPGGRYFFTRNMSSIFASAIGHK